MTFSKQGSIKINPTVFMVLAFLFLSTTATFGQTAIENNTIVNTTTEISTIKAEASPAESNMNFVLWFMGSKQDPNAKAMPAGVSAKKQFITSGTEPNRLLLKAFLKKAINLESATA